MRLRLVPCALVLGLLLLPFGATAAAPPAAGAGVGNIDYGTHWCTGMVVELTIHNELSDYQALTLHYAGQTCAGQMRYPVYGSVVTGWTLDYGCVQGEIGPAGLASYVYVKNVCDGSELTANVAIA